MAFATGINLETGKTELFDFINISKSGTYKGLWDASTNTPFLTNGTGEDGDYYEVSVGGTVNFGDGDIIFVAGDTVAYSRGKWQKGDKPLIDDEEISYDTTWSSAKILQVIETASTADVYTYKGETAVLPDGTEETPNNKGDVWLLTTDGLPYWWDGDIWRRFGVDAYTKTETENVIEEKLEPVETKLASALKYRGAVNTTALLPASAENGDTYFVKADGFMYTYNSTTSSWDALGTVAGMTNYFTKTEIIAMLQDKADKFQYDVLPAPSSETVGVLLQYTGADTQDYKNSYFYKGVDKGNDTYSWELAKTGDYYSKSEVDDLLENKVDYKVVVENGSRYVEDIVTQEINNWLPNDNSSILINLKKVDGANYANFQLFCNKQDNDNWSCIVSGGVNALWKIRYVNGVRYIDELATKSDLTASTDITLTTYTNSAFSIIELKAVRLGLNTIQVAGILEIKEQCETLTFASGLPIPKVVTLSPHSMQIQAMCYRGTSSGASERVLINNDGSMTVYTNTSGGNLYFSCEYTCI